MNQKPMNQNSMNQKPMIHNAFKIAVVGLFVSIQTSLFAQSLVLDGIGVGASVTVTGGGGPPSSSVELVRNGLSAGSVSTTAFGQFSFPNVTAAGLNPNNPADAGLDKDGDGQSNLEEYLSDTDPSDPSSRFQVKRLEDAGNPTLLRIVWSSRPGMIYHVETSDSLLPGSWLPLNGSPIIGYTAETSYDAPVTGDRRFYRVQAFRPNPLIVVP